MREKDSAEEEFDLDGTISSTAKKAGYLDVKLRPERKNRVKLLLFLDVGGSMDPHVEACEELFSAAKSEFKNLEYFYFHNCIYETLWKNNPRSSKDVFPTHDIIRKFGADTARWFVLSDSPPDRDIFWTEAGIESANKFIGKIYIMMGEYKKILSGDKSFNADEQKQFLKLSHKTLKDVTKNLEEMAFNQAIANIYY